MLVDDHVHALATEADSFHFEAHALFERGFAVQLDGAAGTEYALPGQRTGGRFAQQLRHLAMIERITGGGGDLSVCGHLPAWNLADGFAEGGVAPRVFGRAQEFARGLARVDAQGGTANHGSPES